MHKNLQYRKMEGIFLMENSIMKADNKLAQELSYISKWAGCCDEIVQAGGGNTSVKSEGGLMLIKSSGYQLSEVTEEQGFSEVNYERICEYMSTGSFSPDDEQKLLAEALIGGKRPSIETFLHSITKRYTIHTHPLCATMLLVRRGGMDILKELFPSAVTVNYATPGIKLAHKLYEAVKKYGRTDIIFLENHGIIVSADSAEEAVKLHFQVISAINSVLGISNEMYELNCRLFDIVNSFNKSSIVYRCRSAEINKCIEAAKGGEWLYKFSPDCVVYCGGSFAVIRENDDAKKVIFEYTEKFGLPKVIIAGGTAFVTAETIKKAKEIECVLDFTAQIFLHEKDNAPHTLDNEETGFLLKWDSEKYRSSIKN